MPFYPIQHYTLIDDPLNLFDPWRDCDVIPTALALQPNGWRHLRQPAHINPKSCQHSTLPHAKKFRVQLDVTGFNPETIKTKVEGRKVIVEAKQEDQQADGDYHIRKLRKSYDLPEHADANGLTSQVTKNHMLVIEVPIKTPEEERRLEQAKKDQHNLAQFGQYRDPLFDYMGFLGGSDFQPRIVDKENNQKQLELTVGMKSFQPQELKVSVKNNELIVKGEHRHEGENGVGQSFFYRSIMLPPGTQVDQLQSHLTDDGQLKIEAPYIEQTESQQSPADHNQENQKPVESQQQPPQQ